MLLPYTNPTPKPYPSQETLRYFRFQYTPFCVFYKRFEKWEDMG